MDNISVVGFQKEYTLINLKLMKENIKLYDMLIINIYGIELGKGFLVKKINKTTRTGTKVTFKMCDSKEEAEAYGLKIKELIKEFRNKYLDVHDVSKYEDKG